MPWKKILKIVGAVAIGGGIGSGVPTESLNVSPDIMQAIQAVITAVFALIMLLTNSPNNPKEDE